MLAGRGNRSSVWAEYIEGVDMDGGGGWKGEGRIVMDSDDHGR